MIFVCDSVGERRCECLTTVRFDVVFFFLNLIIFNTVIVSNFLTDAYSYWEIPGLTKVLLHSISLYFEGCARLREGIRSNKMKILHYRDMSQRRVRGRRGRGGESRDVYFPSLAPKRVEHRLALGCRAGDRPQSRGRVQERGRFESCLRLSLSATPRMVARPTFGLRGSWRTMLDPFRFTRGRANALIIFASMSMQLQRRAGSLEVKFGPDLSWSTNTRFDASRRKKHDGFLIIALTFFVQKLFTEKTYGYFKWLT